MMNALFNGVSGLRVHQRRMDVIGNNISNVNTAGFKRGRAEFAEMLGRQLVGSSGAIGNGVALSGVTQSWTQGSFEFTGLGTDLALAGDGFFIAQSPEGQVLTRAGNFGFNADGGLVTAGGLPVQGWPVQANGTVYTGAPQDVRLNLDLNSPPVETSTARMTGNLSADLRPGNPDANPSVSRVIYDGQGRAHTLVLTFEKTSDTEWTVATAELAGDPDATPPVPPTVLTGAGGTVEFDAEGNLVGPVDIALGGTFPNSTDDVDVTVNLEGLTHYGGSTTVGLTEQNGQAAGEVAGYGFDEAGQLLVQFSNGEERAIFQLAIGTVTNANGLEQRGDGLYAATMASGDLTVGRAGQDIATGVISGALEMSNVDLASEFTDMIVTQRGYQASARVITTSDELLQEVVSLKR
jgi:flagellar hook protein FlgE